MSNDKHVYSALNGLTISGACSTKRQVLQVLKSSNKSCSTESFARLIAGHLLSDYSDRLGHRSSSHVVEVRTGKMATANKLAVLQKLKQEKHFLFGSFSNDMTNKKK
jgi:hypothetical protein